MRVPAITEETAEPSEEDRPRWIGARLKQLDSSTQQLCEKVMELRKSLDPVSVDGVYDGGTPDHEGGSSIAQQLAEYAARVEDAASTISQMTKALDF
jgi:hypothetical protein